MLYIYKAIDNNANRIINGVCFANNESELFKIFSSQNLKLFFFKKKNSIFTSKRNLSENFIIPLFKCLHTLISSNLDVVSSLKITMCSFPKPDDRAIVEYILFKISNGSSISRALEDCKIFDPVCVKTIEIAEKTATLPKAFQYIIEYMDNEVQTTKLIRTSLIYPIMLFCTISLIMFFWIFFIIPNFADAFNDMGIKLPFITSLLLDFRNFCNDHEFVSTFGVISIFALCIVKRRSLISMIPVVKRMKRDIMIFRFFSSMCLMAKEKINFIDSLSSSASITNDKNFEKAVNEIIFLLKSGSNISEAFKMAKLFTFQEAAIIEAGESVGNMAGAFKIVADTLQRNTKNTIEKITAMFQPVVTIIMGLILVFVVYSVFLPMYDQISAVQM